MSKEKVTRREFITAVGAVGAVALAAGKVGSGQANEPEATFLPRIIGAAGEGAPMNVITITCDTFRYDHIGFHGNDWIHTPNIDAFAGQSIVFERAYSGGFPTVYNRSELFTGRYMYPFMAWEDLPAGEVVLGQVLSDAGFATGLVFDTLHLKDKGFFLDRGFQSWEWIRGQERDRYRATPPHPQLPADASKLRGGAAPLEQYLRNNADRVSEADYLVARTMQAAINWLRRSHSYGPFYLHVDSFDPHEPWDPPQHYVDLYKDPEFDGEEVIYPAHMPPDYLTAAELEHVRALYAAEVTMVDHWLGQLLTEIDDLGLADRTVLIFMSDHGFLHGEHNAIGKTWTGGGHFEAYPLFQELVHIPLMIRYPGQAHRLNQEALVQPADIMPTVLEIMGAPDPGAMHGSSLIPYFQAGSGSPREYSVTSRTLTMDLAAKPRAMVTDGQWTLMDGAAHAPSQLYYLPDDPQQLNDLIASECGMARALHQALLDLWQVIGVPAAMLDVWRPAPC